MSEALDRLERSRAVGLPERGEVGRIEIPNWTHGHGRGPAKSSAGNEAQESGEGKGLTSDRVVVRGTGESRPGRVKVGARASLFVLVLDDLRLFDNLVPRSVLRQALQFLEVPQAVPARTREAIRISSPSPTRLEIV